MTPMPDLKMWGMVALMLPLVGLGVAVSARLIGTDKATARRQGVTACAAIAAWLLTVGALAAAGFFSRFDAVPPRLPAVPLIGFLTGVTLMSRPAVQKRIAAMPRHWMPAAQTFRLGVEWVLHLEHVRGRAPVQVTWHGRNWDVLVGLTAPIMAWLIATKRAPPRAAAVWNLAGLAILANTVVTVMTSVPGALKLAWPGEPFAEFASWRLICLPAFLAPLAVFMHVASLRQNLGGGGSAAALQRKEL